MKRIFGLLALIPFLWLNGCYYSRYEKVNSDYYSDDSTYYYTDQDNCYQPGPPVVVITQPYPVTVSPKQQSNPVNTEKYRTGTSTQMHNQTVNNNAYRNSTRNIDMTNVHTETRDDKNASNKQDTSLNQNENNSLNTNTTTRNNTSGRGSSSGGDRGR